MEIQEEIYDYIISNAGASELIAARIFHHTYENKYRIHVIGHRKVWFEVNTDNTLSEIEDIVLRNKLSTDIADLVMMARKKFKNDEKYNKIDFISINKSLESLNLILTESINKRKELRELNKIDEGREIDSKIKDTESAIHFIKRKLELQRADNMDKIFSGLIQLESSLYNSTFKNKVIKELEGLFIKNIDVAIKDANSEQRKAIPKKIRGEAWKIQFGDSTKGSCFCCKKELDAFDDWHAGHIVSHSNNGKDTSDNLRPVCGSCNLSMGTENMDDFKARCYPN